MSDQKERFHNPYNFIPAVTPCESGPLGRCSPAGHDRYHPGKWGGRIGIEIEVVTPLLIPDAARATKNKDGHETFSMRRGPDGRPLLPVTSLKGPLRAAFEAITNSRMAVFSKHGSKIKLGRKKKSDLAPSALLCDGLKPAKTLEELSAADRVFGWVSQERQESHGAYKGQLHIRPICCKTPASEAIERFDGEGLALAILSTPKVAQGRFYVGGKEPVNGVSRFSTFWRFGFRFWRCAD